MNVAAIIIGFLKYPFVRFAKFSLISNANSLSRNLLPFFDSKSMRHSFKRVIAGKMIELVNAFSNYNYEISKKQT